MSTLVTGGKGFIGSRIVNKLVAQGEPVVCLEPKTTPGRLADIAERVSLVAGDIRRLDDILSAIKQYGVTRIAHMVYYSSPPDRPDLLHQELDTMAMGTFNIYEAARQTGIKRAVFASSIRYYGPQWLHGEKPLTEDDPSLAESIYGVTKRLSEVVAHAYNQRAGMSIVSLRISGVYGPGGMVGARGVNLAAVESALGRPVTLPYARHVRVLIAHVDDTAEACIRLLQAKAPRYESYNLGGHLVTYGEMADTVKDLIPEAQISFNENNVIMDMAYLMDYSRLRQEFGFEHRPVKEGFREVINYTRQQAGLPILDSRR